MDRLWQRILFRSKEMILMVGEWMTVQIKVFCYSTVRRLRKYDD